MSFSNLLSIYENSPNQEFEIRTKVEKNDVENLINSADGDVMIQQTIDFYVPSGKDGNKIASLSFMDGVKKDFKYVLKKRIASKMLSNSVTNYKIAVSLEQEISKFNYNISNMARIKLRYSILLEKFPEWRIDITLVKRIVDINKSLKRYKDLVLFKIDKSNFIEKAPWLHIDGCELEIEHIGSEKKINNAEVENVIEYTFNLINPNYKIDLIYTNTIEKIVKSLFPDNQAIVNNKKSLKRIYSPVFEISKDAYYRDVYSNVDNFYLLDKADGVRTLGLIELTSVNDGNILFINDKIVENKLSEDAIVKIKNIEKITRNKNISYPYIFTIFDCEYVNNKYYVFDTLLYNGNTLMNETTDKRISYIPSIVELVSNHNVVEKEIITLTSDNFCKVIEKTWKRESEYEIDGLIFTPKNESYRNTKSWKWKPLKDMSIDFMVKKPKQSIFGTHPYINKKGYTMLFLFTSITRDRYNKYKLHPVTGYQTMFPGINTYRRIFPIQFSPSDKPYAYIYYHPNDSKFNIDDIIDNVCEFRRSDYKKFEKEIKEDDLTLLDDDIYVPWELTKVRFDKINDVKSGDYFGNTFYAAEYIWRNYYNPLLLKDLIIKKSEMVDSGYFREVKSDLYKHMTAFNSFVKYNLIKKYNGSKWLVDLFCGKGQDIFRVSENKISNALYLDKDPYAISELIERKNTFQRNIHKMHTRIYTKIADLKDDYNVISESVKKLGVPVGNIDIVMCNFGIHYLSNTGNNINNLVNLIHELLKVGGEMFFTSFDGKKVFNLLKDKKSGESWDCRTDTTLQYSIIKKFSAKKLQDVGQEIQVLLPFSKGEYYTEYLVNFSYIESVFKSKNFKIVKKGNFGDFFEGFEKSNPAIYKKMSKIDKEFSQLYSYMIVQKKTI